MEHYNLYLPKDLKDDLKECSDNTKIPMSQLVRIAIKGLLRQYKGEGIMINED